MARSYPPWPPIHFDLDQVFQPEAGALTASGALHMASAAGFSVPSRILI
jgi:hypothetical protein